MTADPRVEAVTAARAQHRPLSAGWLGGVRCSVCDWEDRALLWPDHLDAVAVAALDAYDGPRFSSVVHECCERPTEADLRERIAQEIEACLPTPCRDLGRGCACSLCYETHAYRDAARIARGGA